MPRASVGERLDADEDGLLVLTGTFDCWAVDANGRRHEAVVVGVDAALGWARARAARVELALWTGAYGVGDTPSDLPPLDDATLAWARRGRRRAPGDEWLDRPPTAEPVPWAVEAHLAPDDLDEEHRTAQLPVVEGAVAALRAMGADDVAWDADELDAGLADLDRQDARGITHWTTCHALAFRLRAAVVAPTHWAAEGLARSRLRAALTEATGRPPHEEGAEVLDGWGLGPVVARPPGAAPPEVGPG